MVCSLLAVTQPASSRKRPGVRFPGAECCWASLLCFLAIGIFFGSAHAFGLFDSII